MIYSKNGLEIVNFRVFGRDFVKRAKLRDLGESGREFGVILMEIWNFSMKTERIFMQTNRIFVQIFEIRGTGFHL